MYLPEALPIPWRALGALERLGLRALPWRDSLPELRRPGSQPSLRLLALGDIALTPAAQVEPARAFSGIAPLLAAADLRTANLEAQLTARTERAGVIGSGIRAEPAMIAALLHARFDVLSVANNHALDFGNAGLAESVQRLADAGIRSCGLANADRSGVPAILEARGKRIAVLGFCDDHFNGPDVQGSPRPALATFAEVEASVRAAREIADLVIVHLHWGYEFALHPLLDQRDFARRVVDCGAHLVLCHHAHVPLGFELRGAGAIAYGLGNGLMAMSPYLRSGHAWTDRSAALEIDFDEKGACALRAHPIGIRPDGSVFQLDDADGGRSLRVGLEKMCKRLDDASCLGALQSTRLVVESLRIPAALRQAAAASKKALRERLGALTLPRQVRLIEFLSSNVQLRVAAAHLSRLRTASVDGIEWGEFPLDEVESAFSRARASLLAQYSWIDALRARIP
jgi:hypothetical protein